MAGHNKCCNGCAERAIGCHAACERYAKERAHSLAEYKERDKRREIATFAQLNRMKIVSAQARMKQK